MAEYPGSYSQQALQNIGNHANNIHFVAGSLGVSPHSVAAGIAREQTLESDVYPNNWWRVGLSPVKQVLEYILMNSSNADIRSQYDKASS